jgi:ElaB/YqjD/DUF883 family membrane-anchored ribosome-binding protein
MASSPDMAPGRVTPTTTPNPTVRSRSTAAASPRSRASADRPDRSADLELQITRLQEDIRALAATVGALAEEKVAEARDVAKTEAKNLARNGQQAVEDMQDEFGQLEKQIKDTIREKPLTAVAGAIALGFILAVVSR